MHKINQIADNKTLTSRSMKIPLRWRLAQSAELKWWQRYLRHKPTKEYLEWKKNYWTSFLEQIKIGVNPSEHVLDAGCGPAGLFIILKDNKVDALDPLLEAYERKLDHFSMEQYPSVRFFNQSLESFEAPQQYDTVFCLNAINHVADLKSCFYQLNKLTKPGGRLILSVDAHNYPILKKIFQTLPGDILHPHQYNLGEYQDMLENSGFEVDSSLLVKRELIFNYYVCIAHKTEKVKFS